MHDTPRVDRRNGFNSLAHALANTNRSYLALPAHAISVNILKKSPTICPDLSTTTFPRCLAVCTDSYTGLN